MSTLVSGLVTYIGDPDIIGSGGVGVFDDMYEPVPGKSEWGMDTLNRLVGGIQPNLVNYMNSLAQGQTYVYNGNTFYLQTWECDNNQVFPKVQLHYKGLIAGIPTPRASGSQIEQSVQIAADLGAGVYDPGSSGSSSSIVYTSATRHIQYITRQTVTKYIATARPTTGSYGLDIDFTIQILNSVITGQGNTLGGTSSTTWSGANAPAGIVSALTPATYVLSLSECEPVVGSPYFECTDRATLLYAG